MKNIYLNFKKSKNQTFEISMWVKKRQKYLSLQKMRACARGGKLFSSYKQKIREKESFKLIKVKIKKK